MKYTHSPRCPISHSLSTGLILLLAPALVRATAAPTLATLAIPGEAAFVTVAKDILDVRFAVDPSIAAGGGLFDDAARVPSFDPDTVSAQVARLDADMAALRAMDYRNWSVDRRVDWRWVYAIAEDTRLQLADEKLYLHRPASWLEPLANTLVALMTYAPERGDVRMRLSRAIPGMVAEMRRVVASPTERDMKVAEGVAEGIIQAVRSEPPGAERDAAIAALSGYVEEIRTLTNLPEYSVIGPARYQERMRRALLLPWSPQELLSLAERELARVDTAMAALRPRVSPAPKPTPAQMVLAQGLNQEKMLELYNSVTSADRAFLDKSDILTVPAEVGPIRARPTPEGMIPLTGDGGSMNPPPPIGDSNVGWWNVEHFQEATPLGERAQRIVSMQEQRVTGMGPYGVHEGVPGHHLQLSIARLNPNPLRCLIQDNVLVEGWAMYAEEMFWRAGGFGDSPDAEYKALGSWRGRIRRVFYDVHVECGDWNLQQAAEFKYQGRDKVVIDEDILRAINWPAQLICYFTGKTQIRELRDAYRAKLGPEFTDRKFHDALLAEGSIPVALIRAKLLGEPVPEP
jgi:hypothetical protein